MNAYPFESLLVEYPELEQVWRHIEQGAEIESLPAHLQAYAYEVESVMQSLAETEGSQECRDLALARLYRLTRLFLGMESRVVTEEEMVLEDRPILHLSLLAFGEELWSYLWVTRGMVTLGEGRREIDQLFNQLMLTRQDGISAIKKLPNLGEMSFHRQRIKRIVKKYFADYGKSMKVFHREEIDWDYLRGLIERTSHLARKTLYQANQVPLAYQLKQIGKSSEAVLTAIPASVNNQYRAHERKAYVRMLDDLVFLRSDEARGVVSLF